MLIYEVTATVEGELSADFESFMTEKHIPELLATEYFTAAFFAQDGCEYRIGYHADSRKHLDEYLANDAERLRADMAEHFPTGVEVSRRVFDIVALFPGRE